MSGRIATLPVLNDSVRGAYPLTPMQQAYWIGEKNGYRLNTAASLYRGFRTTELDVQRLEQALLVLMVNHPALRTRVHADSTQSIAAMPERYEVRIRDLRHQEVAFQESLAGSRKDAASEHLPGMDSGCQFACFVDRVHDGYRVHFLFRLLILDGYSLALFFNDLTHAYSGRAINAPTAAFREYAERLSVERSEPEYQLSLDYWNDKLKTLPSAPDLPIRDLDEIPGKSVFRRLQICLEPADVQQLGLQARKLGVTLNALLCTLFADVLRMWSRHPAFTLNLLISNRPADDARFDRTIGNFSNTLLLEVPVVEGDFQGRARALQRQLFREIEYRKVSGVDVIRMMSRPASVLPAMPVVFASTLGLENGSMAAPAELGWRTDGGGMNTPQVWLDHQVYMDEGRLILNWDYVDGVFMVGVIEEMFETYGNALRQLLALEDSSSLVPSLPETALAARRLANQTARVLPQGLLHDFFHAACGAHPKQTALIASRVEISYRELFHRTTHLAATLRRLGVCANDLVAIVARRSWRQVAAVIATVQSGGAYLPVAHDLPQARKQWLIQQPGVKVVLGERECVASLSVPADVIVLALEDVLPDEAPTEAVTLANVQHPHDLAYVIFTSGSTGQPKGVAIDHRGAVNTLQDVIARFGLDTHDRVIGLSAFNFDLSVYDIFATLGRGATLVLPPYGDGPSPADWAKCLQEHGVTVWNSVPALLEMLLEVSAGQAAAVFASLRLIMLSGDWIPVSLPGRMAAVAPNATFVSMGGATEASIWSNYFIIDTVNPAWRSIPYGWPLSNQSFHVLDDALQARPAYAVGELYIGGIGLAQGYYRDPERTSQSFITQPQTGERLYKTSDLGRYRSDGCLEFLGRNDTQVKIHGHRMELGEIDAVLERCPGVRSAASLVKTVGEQHGLQLLAFYVRDRAVSERAVAIETSIRQHLSDLLPQYMVPSLLVEIDHMPVTANGKIDRAALGQKAAVIQITSTEKILPRNDTERALSSLWEGLLGIESPGVHDDFFALGGSSLLAVRLLNAIAVEFGQSLSLASLLRHGTIAAQAGLIRESAPQDHARSAGSNLPRKAVVCIRDAAPESDSRDVLVAVHPVGGNILCYRELLDYVPADMTVIGIQSRGDGVARTVTGMAASYSEELASHISSNARISLWGWSMGGAIAQEMARLLENAGATVANLIMIDSWVGNPALDRTVLEGHRLLENFARDLLQTQDSPKDLESLLSLPEARRLQAVRSMLDEAGGVRLSAADFDSLLAEHRANFNALIRHRPQATCIAPVQFRATRLFDFPFLVPFPASVGNAAAPGETIDLDETHFSIVRGECLRRITDMTLGSKNLA
ncbi:amino acid adenylation domain-containing protein [Caballeronia sp. LP006]|uniref:non-ribosomal peptide synthetase n=1 Tax=Caballeronia sp. LP006 TaxID=3038552 RepID=UPI0028541CD5|nr:amino acid adenylation domain-containing protein [Caballeronia sp. LP006]MDR5831163.1 amino acid adenylation domain-containing protein [Caballeronia sp. LP006]